MFLTLSNVLVSFAALTSSNASRDVGATSTTSLSSAVDNGLPFSHRSNATHFVWTSEIPRRHMTKSLSGGLSEQVIYVHHQTARDAERDCLEYLEENLMAFDLPFKETLGFPSPKSDSADGLDQGLVGPTVKLALEAKRQYPWTDSLPKDIFQNYVLNFANLNEARTNWRPLLVETLNFTNSELYRSGNANISSVVEWANTVAWKMLARNPEKPIYFKSSQTPLIFDPMSIIAYGYASCTGVSILFVNILRSLGIPSRVVGTPAWYGNATRGNHNWVEVYVNGEWVFLEAAPATPGHVDTLEKNPCSSWFCRSDRYPASQVFAAKYTKGCSQVKFPLAWELDCLDVPAENRTEFYTNICRDCGAD